MCLASARDSARFIVWLALLPHGNRGQKKLLFLNDEDSRIVGKAQSAHVSLFPWFLLPYIRRGARRTCLFFSFIRFVGLVCTIADLGPESFSVCIAVHYWYVTLVLGGVLRSYVRWCVGMFG